MGGRRFAVALILLALPGCEADDAPAAAAEPDALVQARAEWAAIDVRMSVEFAGLPLDLPDEELQQKQAEVEELFRPEREAIRARLAAQGLSLD